jgi:hypothetical protein
MICPSADTLVSRLIGDIKTFKAAYWERRPFHFRSTNPEYVKSLFSLSNADSILSSPATRPPYVEVKRDGYGVREGIWTGLGGSKSIPIADAVRVDMVAAEFAKGATILLQNLEDHDILIGRLTRELESFFRAHIVSVAFITPPGQQGHRLHYDAFEGLIIQTHGTKKWCVYDAIVPRPRKSTGINLDEKMPVALEATLQAGDVLYVPWGSPHFAVAGESVSCHLTLAIWPPSWEEKMAEIISASIPAAAKMDIPSAGGRNISEQRILCREYLRNAIDCLDDRHLQQIAEQWIGEVTGPITRGSGFVEQALRCSSLTDNSQVSRTSTTAFDVKFTGDGALEVRLTDLTLKVDARFADALSVLSRCNELALSEIPSTLGRDPIFDLVRRLVEHGALRVSLSANLRKRE